MHIRYNFSNHKLAYDKKITLVGLTSTVYENEASLMHSHKHTEIILSSKERGFLFTKREKLNIEYPGIYIIKPEISHSETTVNKNFHYYTIKLKNLFINNVDNNDILFLQFNEREYNVIIKALNNIFAEIDSTDAYKKELILLQTEFVLFIIFREINKRNIDINNNKSKSVTGIKEIKSYIDTHYNENIKIPELAKMFAMSNNSLISKFKKTTGLSPSEYLIDMRIKIASDLLVTVDYNISQIISMIGFNNHAFFSKCFKKKMEMSPIEYRKKNKNQTRQQ